MIIFVSADDGGIAFRLKDNREGAWGEIMMLAVSKFNLAGSRASETIL
jgi:hypothetical protein